MANRSKKPNLDIPDSLLAEWRTRLARPATVFKATKKLPADPFASRFGAISVIAPGEEWPTCPSGLMLPLAQFNLRAAPYLPGNLADLAMIRVWVDPEYWERDWHAGEGWCLRASTSLDGLKPMPEPSHESPVKAMGLKATRVDADFPSHDDLPPDLPDQISEQWYDLFPETHNGAKLGGWPLLVQSEITWWSSGKPHPINPEFAFQIDSEADADWNWGDCGVGYFGRGTGKHRDKWAFEWQCC